MTKIGYYQLSVAEKKAYEKFEKVFASFGTVVDMSGIDRNVDAMKVLLTVLGDNPQIVYFDKTQIKVSSSLFGSKQIRLCGTFSQSHIKAINQELERAVQKVVEEIELLNPMTPYDKLLYTYEYLQDHVIYDTEEFKYSCSRNQSANPMSHNAYGTLVKGKGVCDGISSAFALIAQKLGFECSVVMGKAAFRTLGEHTWNVIKVGESFYHLDVTWELDHKEQTGEYSYEYFCISDETIQRDHEWERGTMPVCHLEDMSFYIRSGCYAKHQEQLDEIFKRYAKSRKKVVRVKLAEGISLPEPEETYLGQRLLQVASNVGRCCRIRYKWNKTMRCFYAKFEG